MILKNYLQKIIIEAKDTKYISLKNIVSILQNDDINEFLFQIANEVRKQTLSDAVHLRGLIEFSNICNKNCKYCGLQAKNVDISRYSLKKEEIINISKQAKKQDFKTIVLQSGESDNVYSLDEFCDIISEICKLNLVVTLSIGEKSFEEYKAFRLAGAKRFLLRIETTDKKLYESLHPNSSFENRLACLKILKKLGFETGTGILVGLPNQTIQSIAYDIVFLQNFNPDMIGLGPFIPHFNTPLKNFKYFKDPLQLSLKVLAILRILLPDINIPATTAMETIEKNAQIKALNCGANVVMLNIGDIKQKEKYQIYPNKVFGDKLSISEQKQLLIKKLNKISRRLSGNFGFRRGYEQRNDI